MVAVRIFNFLFFICIQLKVSSLPDADFKNVNSLFSAVIAVRAPQSSRCGLVLISNRAESSFLNLERLQLPFFQIFSKNVTGSQSPELGFRYSNPCLHVVIMELEQSKLTKQWHSSHLFKRSVSYVHFIFVGLKNSLLLLFEHVVIKSLKYKTGLVIGDPSETNRPDSVITADTGITQLHTGVQHLPTDKQLFSNQLVKIVVWRIDPYVVYDDKGDMVPGIGMGNLIVATVAARYNFSYEQVTELKSVKQLPNGTWEGVMHDMTEGDTDIFFYIGVNAARYPYLDYPAEIYTASAKFYTAHPEISVKWQAILYPLDPQVWLLVGIAVLISIPVFYAHLGPHSVSRHLHHYGPFDALFLSLTLTLSSLLMRTIIIPPNAKFLTLTFVFFAMIINTAYNSNLISYLTFPEPELVPETFSELADRATSKKGRYDVQLCYMRGSTATTLLEQSNISMHVKLQSVIHRERNFSKCLQDAAFNPRTACVCYDIIATAVVAKSMSVYHDWIPVKESSDSLLLTPNYAVTRKNSRYTDAIRRHTNDVRESGLGRKWWNDANEYKRTQFVRGLKNLTDQNRQLLSKLSEAMSKSHVGELKPFTMANFVVCFSTWVCGLGFASVCFYFEVAIRWANSHRTIS